jgi:hypothetical protein
MHVILVPELVTADNEAYSLVERDSPHGCAANSLG